MKTIAMALRNLFRQKRRTLITLSALIIGAVPLWVVLMRTATRDRPPAIALAGVVVGFAGLALLVRPGGGSPLWALMLVVLSSLMWATGSFLSSRLPLPQDSFAATSIEMLAGGAILLPIGLAATHPHFSEFSARSIFGWFYLVTFGSLVGYTAYVWLLDNAPLGTVATYAYVNPVVAIALGAVVLHESLTWTIGVGAVLVLACVALVVRTETGLELSGEQRVHRPVDAPSEPGIVVRGPEDAVQAEPRLLRDAP